MEKIRPYLTREHGVLIGVALILVALCLRALGILGLTVAFWAGFASCLALEAWAVYYFLIKFETKTEEKLEAYVHSEAEYRIGAGLVNSDHFGRHFVVLSPLALYRLSDHVLTSDLLLLELQSAQD